MRGLRLCCACVVALFVVACGNKGPTAAEKATLIQNQKVATGGTTDDYQVMQQVLTFTPAELENFKQKLSARDGGYRQWAQSDEGKQFTRIRQEATAAQRSGDQAKVAELQAQLKPLQAKQVALRENLRRQFDADALTLAQQREWGGYKLFTQLRTKLRSASLSDEQLRKVREICNTVAADSINRNTYKNDPYLLLPKEEPKALDMVQQQVLTPEQRQKLA